MDWRKTTEAIPAEGIPVLCWLGAHQDGSPDLAIMYHRHGLWHYAGHTDMGGTHGVLVSVAAWADPGLPESFLPDADCEHCKHMQLPHDGGHCYMFEVKPGEKCGQFSGT